MNKLFKERSAKLIKKWPYVVARYAHVTLARDHVQLSTTPLKPLIFNITKFASLQY